MWWLPRARDAPWTLVGLDRVVAESVFELREGSFALFSDGAGEARVGPAGEGLSADVVEQGAVESDQRDRKRRLRTAAAARRRRQAPQRADDPARAPAPPRSGRRRRRCPVAAGSGSRSRSRCRGSAPAAGSRRTARPSHARPRRTPPTMWRRTRPPGERSTPSSACTTNSRFEPLPRSLSPDIGGAGCRS
jgi:hypothetical protein